MHIQGMLYDRNLHLCRCMIERVLKRLWTPKNTLACGLRLNKFDIVGAIADNNQISSSPTLPEFPMKERY